MNDECEHGIITWLEHCEPCEKKHKESKSAFSGGVMKTRTLREKMDRLTELNKQIDEAEKGGVVGREERNSLLKIYEEWRKLDKEIWAS